MSGGESEQMSEGESAGQSIVDREALFPVTLHGMWAYILEEKRGHCGGGRAFRHCYNHRDNTNHQGRHVQTHSLLLPEKLLKTTLLRQASFFSKTYRKGGRGAVASSRDSIFYRFFVAAL
jgi:hypothetical protein